MNWMRVALVVLLVVLLLPALGFVGWALVFAPLQLPPPAPTAILRAVVRLDKHHHALIETLSLQALRSEGKLPPPPPAPSVTIPPPPESEMYFTAPDGRRLKRAIWHYTDDKGVYHVGFYDPEDAMRRLRTPPLYASTYWGEVHEGRVDAAFVFLGDIPLLLPRVLSDAMLRIQHSPRFGFDQGSPQEDGLWHRHLHTPPGTGPPVPDSGGCRLSMAFSLTPAGAPSKSPFWESELARPENRYLFSFETTAGSFSLYSYDALRYGWGLHRFPAGDFIPEREVPFLLVGDGFIARIVAYVPNRDSLLVPSGWVVWTK